MRVLTVTHNAINEGFVRLPTTDEARVRVCYPQRIEKMRVRVYHPQRGVIGSIRDLSAGTVSETRLTRVRVCHPQRDELTTGAEFEIGTIECDARRNSASGINPMVVDRRTREDQAESKGSHNLKDQMRWKD